MKNAICTYNVNECDVSGSDVARTVGQKRLLSIAAPLCFFARR